MIRSMTRRGWSASVALLLVGLVIALTIYQNAGRGTVRMSNTQPSQEDVGTSNNPSAFTVLSAEPLNEMNALFDQTEGWIGADGAHSVSLGAGLTLWLFSDTWVGEIREGRRFDATIVNNSVAVQEERDSTAKIRFTVRSGNDGKPQSLITPDEGRGWFWLQAGSFVDGRLLLFLTQVEKTENPGVFGFRSIGQWIGTVSNPQDDPKGWRLKQLRLPHTIFSPERELTFGAAILERNDFLYIYGTDEEVRTASRDRHLIVARVAKSAAEDFTKWEFFCDGKWHSDFRRSTRLVPDMASDCSVTYLPERQQYALIYTHAGLSERILARAAPDPWGPWSRPVTVYQCPESGWDRRIFCYNAKAHGALSSNDELVLSYIANSFEFWHVAEDARLYWPRFVRVRLSPNKGQK